MGLPGDPGSSLIFRESEDTMDPTAGGFDVLTGLPLWYPFELMRPLPSENQGSNRALDLRRLYLLFRMAHVWFRPQVKHRAKVVHHEGRISGESG